MAAPFMTRILHPTDFSDCAARAQECAMHVATAWDAALEVLHVIEGPPWLWSSQSGLSLVEQVGREASARLEVIHHQMVRSGLHAVVRQQMGVASEQIAQTATACVADLIVLGTQGWSKSLYGLVGSTVERVVRDSPCPVLAVPALSDGTAIPVGETLPPVPIRHILAPVDFSSPSLESVEYALQLAQGVGARMTLLHVLEPVYHDLECGLGPIEQENEKREHWTRQLAALVDLAASLDVRAEFAISGGIPSDAILSSAVRFGCNLIVMGTHGRRGVSRFRFGSVAEAVLRQATCPVLTVKTPKYAPGRHRLIPGALAGS